MTKECRTCQRLDELAKLSCGWDGYTANGISPETIMAAREVAHALTIAGKCISIVPTSAETIAIEWIEGDVECLADIDTTKVDDADIS